LEEAPSKEVCQIRLNDRNVSSGPRQVENNGDIYSAKKNSRAQATQEAFNFKYGISSSRKNDYRPLKSKDEYI
jgi:hypothetical protein